MIHQLGIILVLISTTYLFPSLVAIALEFEKEYISTFLSLFFLCISLAGIMLRFKERELKAVELFFFVIISWVLFFIFCSLPYILILNLKPIDAFFQSVSCLTTTGLRVIDYNIPKIMLIYEAYLQWIGGLSIIIMFLTMISPFPSITRLHFLMELKKSFERGLIIQSQSILFTYFYLTFILFIFLLISEGDIFRSLYFTLTTISTGGLSFIEFSNLNDISKYIICIFTIIASVNFLILYKFVFKRDLSILRDVEFRGILLLITFFAFFLYIFEDINIVESFLQSAFVITTAGFLVIDIGSLSPTSIFLILLLATIGGGYGSTAGGIKIFRIYAFFKILLWYLERISEERKITVLKISSRRVESEEALLLTIFIALYILLIILGTTVLTLFGRDLNEAMLMIVSAQTTLGFQTFEHMSNFEKILLCFYMFAGRIEIIPLFIFIRNLVKIRALV